MNRDKYRKAWLRAHKAYERKAFNILKKYFKNEALKVPYELLDEETYEGSIDKAIKVGGLYNAYYDLYNVIGTIHGERIGKGLNRELKMVCISKQRVTFYWKALVMQMKLKRKQTMQATELMEQTYGTLLRKLVTLTSSSSGKLRAGTTPTEEPPNIGLAIHGPAKF